MLGLMVIYNFYIWLDSEKNNLYSHDDNHKKKRKKYIYFFLKNPISIWSPIKITYFMIIVMAV